MDFDTYMTQCIQLSAIKATTAHAILMLFIRVSSVHVDSRIRSTDVYSILSMYVLCDMAMASKAWRHKHGELLSTR